MGVNSQSATCSAICCVVDHRQEDADRGPDEVIRCLEGVESKCNRLQVGDQSVVQTNVDHALWDALVDDMIECVLRDQSLDLHVVRDVHVLEAIHIMFIRSTRNPEVSHFASFIALDVRGPAVVEEHPRVDSSRLLYALF